MTENQPEPADSPTATEIILSSVVYAWREDGLLGKAVVILLGGTLAGILVVLAGMIA